MQGHGQLVFQATPQDVGVAKGGDAVFRCEATVGGSPTMIGWLLEETTLISGSVVSGVGSVMVSTGNRNVLTLSSLSSSINGSEVSCLTVESTGRVRRTAPAVISVYSPPTAPRSVAVSGEMSFSATVMWTAPEDSGLSSFFSNPSEVLTYHISYNSSSSSTQSLVYDSLEVVLSNLQHSTNYTVRVEASNIHGTSPASNEVHFRTSDSKPILHAVVLAPLSLNNFTANVTFLTVGGQDVASFSITINDSSPTVVDSTPVPDGKGVIVSLLIEGRSFTKGTYYTVEITATNGVGTSEPITGLMYLPSLPTPAPIITAIIVAAVIVVVISTILIIIIVCVIILVVAKKKRGTAKLGVKKSQTEPVYDEIVTDLHAGTSVKIESNPAYATAESVTTTIKPIPGPVDPEYEVMDMKGAGSEEESYI